VNNRIAPMPSFSQLADFIYFSIRSLVGESETRLDYLFLFKEKANTNM